MTTEIKTFRRTRAEIHLGNLKHNLFELKKFLKPNTFLCPMVKANAYGHGDIEIAKALDQLNSKNLFSTLGVGLVEEGLLLRQLGIKSPILVLGSFDRSGFSEMLRWKLTAVVSQIRHLEILESFPDQTLGFHLKFDTGMHRLGFRPDDLPLIIKRWAKNWKLQGLMTHLYQAEDLMDPNGHSFQQMQIFKKIFSSEFFRQNSGASAIPVHSLNSAGFFNYYVLPNEFKNEFGYNFLGEESQEQGVRPGLALYGYSPVAQSHLSLKPVMSLKTAFVQWHRIKKGEVVSYGGTWKAERNSLIGVLPMGYADGYHRLLSNRSKVLFAGQLLPVIGNVCMDYLMVDLTDVENKISENEIAETEVVLFGCDEKQNLLSVEKLAQWSQTITWEILTSVGERVPRIFLHDS